MPVVRKKSNLLVKALIGASIMLAVTAASLLAVGAVISIQDDPLSLVGPGALATVVISSMISALIITGMNTEGQFAVCALSGILFLGVILLLGLFISGGSMGGGVILNLLIYIAILLLIPLLTSRKKKRGARRY